MKKLAASLTAILGLLLSVPVHGQTVTQGVGTKQCSEFTRDVAEEPDEADMRYFAWAQGFMSGMNMVQVMRNAPAFDLGKLDEARLAGELKFLRDFCLTRPTMSYFSGVLSLYGRMPQVDTKPR